MANVSSWELSLLFQLDISNGITSGLRSFCLQNGLSYVTVRMLSNTTPQA